VRRGLGLVRGVRVARGLRGRDGAVLGGRVRRVHHGRGLRRRGLLQRRGDLQRRELRAATGALWRGAVR